MIKVNKEGSYGRKCHMALDIAVLLIMDWLITKGNLHDSHVSHDMMDSIRDFSYILADSAYDASDIYMCLRTHMHFL